MSIPRCRVMLGESETMSRLTLRELMAELPAELPDELYDFELDDPAPLHVDVDWLLASRRAEAALDDELDAA